MMGCYQHILHCKQEAYPNGAIFKDKPDDIRGTFPHITATYCNLSFVWFVSLCLKIFAPSTIPDPQKGLQSVIYTWQFFVTFLGWKGHELNHLVYVNSIVYAPPPPATHPPPAWACERLPSGPWHLCTHARHRKKASVMLDRWLGSVSWLVDRCGWLRV